MNSPIKQGLPDVMAIGKAFAESGMFPDVKSAAQAIVKIQAGAELGIPPFASMSGIHIIKGKPAIGAGVMASMVKGSRKYDYQVVEHSETICRINFFQLFNLNPDSAETRLIGQSTFTLEDAKKAGTQNLDKYARNMLFARAMSNGVKWYCPDVFSGPVYVPEEFDDQGPSPVLQLAEISTTRTISDQLFADALVKVREGALLKDGSKTVCDWLFEDVKLTTEQDTKLQSLLNELNDGTN